MDKAWLSLDEAKEIVKRHDEQRELPPSLVAAASEIAQHQNGWVNVGHASTLLSRLTGESYSTENTPVYKALERGLLEQVKGSLTSETRIEINSFLAYLRAFRVRR